MPPFWQRFSSRTSGGRKPREEWLSRVYL